MAPAKPKAAAQSSIRRHLLVAGLAAFVLIGGMGGWAATTELAGAVIASGQLVAELSVKRVQHPTGGVVRSVEVKEGDIVEAGDVLVQLDETMLRANLGIVTKTLRQLQVRQARLEAERDGSETIAFPQALTEVTGDAELASLIRSEQKLFDLRLDMRRGLKAQLAERVTQLHEEISGMDAQVVAKNREIELLNKDLEGLRTLLEQELIASQRISDLERALAQSEGEAGQLVAAIAQARGRIAETDLQVLQVDQNSRSEVAAELSEVQAKIAEYSERLIAAENELSKATIRSPQSGQVHQLAVHTVGGVIGGGETIMLIVPIADALIIDVKIAPQDIDQVHVGQAVLLRFSAFNLRTTPEINGTIDRVSADLTIDERSGFGFYTARIGVTPDEMARLTGLTMTSGMPVEGFIQTGKRTALSYLTKPLADQIMRSFLGD